MTTRPVISNHPPIPVAGCILPPRPPTTPQATDLRHRIAARPAARSPRPAWRAYIFRFFVTFFRRRSAR